MRKLFLGTVAVAVPVISFVLGALIALSPSIRASQQIINVSSPNTGLGDPAFTAFSKTNSNFTELYGLNAPFLLLQTANEVYASPDGSSGTGSFRHLVAGDLPPVIPPTAFYTATGCSNSTLVGGASSGSFMAAGTFKAGVSGACAITLTFPTASHGWSCYASDITSPVVFVQTGKTTNSCSISSFTVNGDIVTFMAVAY
jgi:hypothetical protein